MSNVPADVTESQLDVWRSEYASLGEVEYSFEVYAATEWLAAALEGAEDVEDVFQGAGQIMFGRDDPWSVATKVLEDYRRGKKYYFGSTLAEELLAGKHNDRFGLGADGASPEGVRRMMQALGVSSLDDLLKQFNCSSKEELKAKLAAELSEIETGMKPR